MLPWMRGRWHGCCDEPGANTAADTGVPGMRRDRHAQGVRRSGSAGAAVLAQDPHSGADRGALSSEAKAGKAVFGRVCASCHAGPQFTDGRFHTILPVNAADRGLAEVTGKAEDEGRFRTPTLRNVAATGPWFHDGSARTLRQAVTRHPVTLDASETDQLLAYLEALTDRGFMENSAFAYPDRPCAKD